jgi:hypothetical protein
MSSAMMMERTSMAMPGMTSQGMGSPVGTPGTAPAGMNWLMVPRCTVRVEKCNGGMKIQCNCSDKLACSTLQNLCTALAGGMVSCCAMMNGQMVYCCNLTMGMCKCEMSKEGCSITCTSGDARCCEMIQSCCDCLATMLKAECTCCVLINNMPVCCGCA